MTLTPMHYIATTGSGRRWLLKLLTPSESAAAQLAGGMPLVSRPPPPGMVGGEMPPPTPEEVVANVTAMEAMVCGVVCGVSSPGSEEWKSVRLSRTEHAPADGVVGLAYLPPTEYTAIVNAYAARLGALADELGSFLG